ncbi:hypothetical protein V0M98_12800 [Pseudomonas silesiensis]|uniref:hypothetical protein n=1 Tax=Pseudomonas silesiensis TaxID=1853130 RepID=UPI0030D1C7C1
MNDLDFTLCSIPMLASRNKSTAYQEQVVLRYTVLMQFLKSHSLIDLEPFDSGGNLKMDLILKKSDTTAQGLELFKKAIPAWHAYVDKGGDVNNTSKLEKALLKLL